jgi:hypothetical protein
MMAAHGAGPATHPRWWRAADAVVWAAVVVIAAIGIEWCVGVVARERLARGASRYLDQVANAE